MVVLMLQHNIQPWATGSCTVQYSERRKKGYTYMHAHDNTGSAVVVARSNSYSNLLLLIGSSYK